MNSNKLMSEKKVQDKKTGIRLEEVLHKEDVKIGHSTLLKLGNAKS